MDIRFCDRCSESIPDADFDSGRAVTVDGRHYHVPCALTRALAINGPRSWLTFVLALYAAGVTTFLLVAVLGKREEPDRITPVVEARIETAASTVLSEAKRDRERAFADLRQESAAARARDATSFGDEIRALLDVLGSRIEEIDRLGHDRISGLTDRVRNVEDEIGKLSVTVREALDRARAEATRQPVPPPAVEPETEPEPEPPPVVEPEPESPTPPAPTRAADHDEVVQKQIGHLKHPNENIRFTAALELGRLKDLRATGPLIEVLEKDRDYYVRLGAATALGDIKACDAVPPLIDALDDKDTLVRTAANDALQAITGQAFEFVADLTARQRRTIMKEWRSWWTANENTVREHLGQPSGG